MIHFDAPPGNPRFARGHLYVRPPRPIEFPAFEPPEEKLSETKRHLENRTALYLVLRGLVAATSSVGSDQFVYFDPTSARRCLSPDVFVKLGVPDRPFRVWKGWEHGAPDLAVEIVSDSDQGELSWEEKLERYRASGIRELVRFDADDREQPIRIWDHVSGDLVERSADDAELCSCHALGLWWVARDDAAYGPMLRLARDREGRELLATPDEKLVAAELAHHQALQALRVAEHEKLVAEEARREEEKARRAEEKARRVAESEVERLQAELLRVRRGQ